MQIVKLRRTVTPVHLVQEILDVKGVTFNLHSFTFLFHMTRRYLQNLLF